MWLFKQKPRKKIPTWKLSDSLLSFSRSDAFSLADACEGVLVVGATGSGKSTGSGKALAHAYLSAGFGGLVLTAKNDERAVWESYCKQTGRLKDLHVFSPDGPYRYNFLDHELQRGGVGAGLTDNIVHIFAQVLQIAERGSGSGGGREDEGYWRRASNQLLRNTIDLLIMAKNRITLSDIYRIIVSAPRSKEQELLEGWRQSSFCFRCLEEADMRPKSSHQAHDFGLVCDYFCLEFPGLSERTRSVICSTMTSMIDVLHRGITAELFCSETNLTPEATENGAIILIDLPIKEFSQVGQFAQVLWKTAFQRSIERRNLKENRRPVFLWADECQYFVTSPFDMQFQTTCRAARVATVLLTQNISNMYAALGGSSTGRVEADSLFGNLNTKIFHANSDPVTNQWASELIGKCRMFLTNSSTTEIPNEQTWLGSATGSDEPATTTTGISEHIDYEVQPRTFTSLRKGGAANHWMVDAIVFQGGKTLCSSGKTWAPVTFNQR
ncbi:MAG: type IV secretory system conjugative DNA transfer family protein [Planctomycetota bacterium]